MAPKLGQLLVKSGVINAQQLEEAIQAQVIFGGKLGTNLIELGYIDIATLGRFLSKKYNVPTIDHTRLKPCPCEVLKLFTKKLAVKYDAIPLGMEGQRLDVLMSNPCDFSAIDEMSFLLGKKIKTYVAPEIIIKTLLEKYYAVPRDLRYVQLSLRDVVAMRESRVNPANKAGVTSASSASSQPAYKPAEREKIKGLELGKSEELTTEEEFQEMLEYYHSPASQSNQNAVTSPSPSKHSAPPPPPPPPPPVEKAQSASLSLGEDVMDLEEIVHEAPQWAVKEPRGMVEEEELEEVEIIEELPEALTLKEAIERLVNVKDRDELSSVVLAFALSYFKRAALFITRGGMALGWDGMGGSINRRTVQGIMLPLNAPSIFKTVYDSSAFFLGAVPKTPLNERFLKLMGNEKPLSVFLIPILFRGKVVNILYGDNGDGKPAPFDISELLILAPKVPQAFEDLIMRKKREAQSSACD